MIFSKLNSKRTLLRTLPPSGSRIYFRDLVECVAQLRKRPEIRLESIIAKSIPGSRVFLFGTGRGAMSFLLRCLALEKVRSSRRRVVIPSYTCYSVVSSVLKAGLEPLVCDIDPTTLCYDDGQLESLDFDKVLAIVSANLYGLPDNLARLEALASKNGAYLIDDAAQSYGATAAGRPVGGFGDAGILSFDKGKVVTSINGGAIVVSNEKLAHRVAAEYSGVTRQSLPHRLVELLKLQA